MIQLRYLYLLSIRQNNFTTSLRRRYLTSFWSCHIVATETSDDVAKTTALQRLIMTSLNKTLQRHRFCNVVVVQRFHHNFIATSEWRLIAMCQQRCNGVILSTRIISEAAARRCFINQLLWKIGGNSQIREFSANSFSRIWKFRPAILLKERLWHRCFSMNFVKLLRTPFYRRPLAAAFIAFWP